MITVGIALRNPVIVRPAIAAPSEGTDAIITLKTLYRTVLMMYNFLRPKASEYGGKMTFPKACAREYL
jgi:hypothetical protein